MSATHHAARVAPTMATLSPFRAPWRSNQVPKDAAWSPKERQLVAFQRPPCFSRYAMRWPERATRSPKSPGNVCAFELTRSVGRSAAKVRSNT